MCDITAIFQKTLGWIKQTILWCIGHMLQVAFFLPIRRNRILISSHSGLQYYCNPKYISEYLTEHYGAEIEIIWGFIHPENYDQIPNIKTVRISRIRWFYYSATAAVVITNVAFSPAQPKRKGQLLIDTWHGGGAYKRVGDGKAYSMSKSEYRSRHESVQKTDLFVSSSRMFTKFLIRQDYGYHGEIIPCGMPRNDLFFDEKNRDRIARRIRSELGISGYIAIYAPTFRGKDWNKYRAVTPFPYQDVLSALRQRFGSQAVILRRAHPGGVMVDELSDGVIDMTDYPDMQELLCTADMLITDYSSSMWDYALLGRPCLLYVPDLEKYSAKPGLCTSPTEWPGLVCRNDAELLTKIRSLNEQECAEKAAQHLKSLGSYETGAATQKVCDRIMRHVRIVLREV